MYIIDREHTSNFSKKTSPELVKRKGLKAIFDEIDVAEIQMVWIFFGIIITHLGHSKYQINNSTTFFDDAIYFGKCSCLPHSRTLDKHFQ